MSEGLGKLLVTGGAGFIGSRAIAALNARGVDDIVVTDRLRSSLKWRNLVGLRFADYLEADDLAERLQADPAALGDVRTVLHFGACSATTERDAAYLIRNNYEYTKMLATWALSRGARFVYASSAATYGALETDLTEERPLQSLRPLNMYGYSKQLFDLYAERNGWLGKMVGLKFFNVFGPGEDHKGSMRSLVNKAVAELGETGAIRLFRSYRPEYADGAQRRDFLYVRDAVEMTLFLAAARGANGIFNIGSGRAHTWLELVTPIFETLGVSPRVDFIDMPPDIRPTYQYYTCADLSRLRAAGYGAPLTDLADAVREYVGILAADRAVHSAPAAAPVTR